MDAKVSDRHPMMAADNSHEDFLLNEGLDMLATYRSIRNETVRHTVREMIAAIAKAAESLP